MSVKQQLNLEVRWTIVRIMSINDTMYTSLKYVVRFLGRLSSSATLCGDKVIRKHEIMWIFKLIISAVDNIDHCKNCIHIRTCKPIVYYVLQRPSLSVPIRFTPPVFSLCRGNIHVCIFPPVQSNDTEMFEQTDFNQTTTNTTAILHWIVIIFRQVFCMWFRFFEAHCNSIFIFANDKHIYNMASSKLTVMW